MTKLLERAFAEAERLPDAEQDALASRLLAELDDETEWSRDDERDLARFALNAAAEAYPETDDLV